MFLHVERHAGKPPTRDLRPGERVRERERESRPTSGLVLAGVLFR